MKQVETRRWKYLFEQNKTFESFFRWQLNSFLSYFTDYGTNPAKAVIKSGWVILLFAIFYLFFPSDWDVSNRSQLLSKVKDLASKNREKSFIATLAFVAYSAFIHILNALTLSLNAFTTLGFGDIPTHGAARYVTIVQGFIGWFLLTIFSVSLINQVLG
ncbi:potassium channel family protein [Salibacteraceae bacterium]|nr:potassium channel family protein [Salibacteraceae bacterium]